MAYKNHEGYPDPTSGQAMKGAHWEELQQLREKEHGLKRGQKIAIIETCKEEHKPAKKVKRIYTVIELYKHCVLLKDEKRFPYGTVIHTVTVINARWELMGIKVTREMLDRYRKLKQEIPVLELELLMMKNTEAGLGNDTIFDYQTGYPRPQSVVGFDQKKYDRREKVLERKKEKVKAMDQWIDDIKDGQTRCVFRMFYKQNMTWKAIAKQIGMPHNEDYPRLHIRDAYLKKCGIK